MVARSLTAALRLFATLGLTVPARGSSGRRAKLRQRDPDLVTPEFDPMPDGPSVQPAADLQKVMKAIKRELARHVWAERGDRVDRSQYMALFMANPVPTWIYDVETLNILAVNDAALAATAIPATSSCV